MSKQISPVFPKRPKLVPMGGGQTKTVRQPICRGAPVGDAVGWFAVPHCVVIGLDIRCLAGAHRWLCRPLKRSTQFAGLETVGDLLVAARMGFQYSMTAHGSTAGAAETIERHPADMQICVDALIDRWVIPKDLFRPISPHMVERQLDPRWYTDDVRQGRDFEDVFRVMGLVRRLRSIPGMTVEHALRLFIVFGLGSLAQSARIHPLGIPYVGSDSVRMIADAALQAHRTNAR